MLMRSCYQIAALCVVLTLSGCDKFPSSVAGSKPSEQSSHDEVDGNERDAVPDAASIAKELSSGNYDKAARGAQAAIEADPHNPELFLLMARAQARMQNVGDAVKALQASFDAGFYDPRGALSNPDFDGIRTNAIFAEFAGRFQPKQVESVSRYRPAPGPGSSITAGDVSIIEGRGGHSHIRAGDIDLKD